MYLFQAPMLERVLMEAIKEGKDVHFQADILKIRNVL